MFTRDAASRMDPLDREDVTAPMSRHNLHVTGESNLIDVGPWSSEQLYAAVKRADSEGELVVLDYGRERLYLAGSERVGYVPPTALGFGAAPGLRVEEPRAYDPEGDELARSRRDSVLVSPEFDILVPAFDRTEPDETWEPPEFEHRDSPSETGVGSGTGVGG